MTPGETFFAKGLIPEAAKNPTVLRLFYWLQASGFTVDQDMTIPALAIKRMAHFVEKDPEDGYRDHTFNLWFVGEKKTRVDLLVREDQEKGIVVGRLGLLLYEGDSEIPKVELITATGIGKPMRASRKHPMIRFFDEQTGLNLMISGITGDWRMLQMEPEQ